LENEVVLAPAAYRGRRGCRRCWRLRSSEASSASRRTIGVGRRKSRAEGVIIYFMITHGRKYRIIKIQYRCFFISCLYYFPFSLSQSINSMF
ncbi:hypothetical protein PFISCL1PPCAC_17192, partial [Pristionchus fissidentatus]